MGFLMLRSQSKSSRVVVDVIPHEGGDEVVRVVVERLHTKGHRVLCLGGGRREILRL